MPPTSTSSLSRLSLIIPPHRPAYQLAVQVSLNCTRSPILGNLLRGLPHPASHTSAVITMHPELHATKSTDHKCPIVALTNQKSHIINGTQLSCETKTNLRNLISTLNGSSLAHSPNCLLLADSETFFCPKN